MNKNTLLNKLPRFNNSQVLIEKKQGVNDIIKEVLNAHQNFAGDYDLIAADFNKGSILQICRDLFFFLKSNVKYKIESESRQTTKSPGAVLALGDTVGGDCKHYAGFIAGVLDAIKRTGKKIDWWYRFASYTPDDPSPQHVFVVVNIDGREVWVDPVLENFNQRLEPNFKIDKKVKPMSLYRVSGVGDASPVNEFTTLDYEDAKLPPETLNSIRVLLAYKVLNNKGQVNDKLLAQLSQTLSPGEFQKVSAAREVIQSAAIGGFFADIWNGIKKVTVAGPRNAYLSLVALNVFGYATKLRHAIWDKNFHYTPGKDKLKSFWESLGGNYYALENAVRSGSTKKAILGVAAAAAPAWIAIASAVIAAIAPIIKSLLTQNAQAGALDPSINPATGLPYSSGYTSPSLNNSGGAGNNIDPLTGLPVSSAAGNSVSLLDYVKANPVIVAVAGAGVLFLVIKKSKRA